MTGLPSGFTIGIPMAKSKTKIPRSGLPAIAISEDAQRQENRQLLEHMNATYQDASDVEEEKRLRQMRKLQRRLLLTEPREAE